LQSPRRARNIPGMSRRFLPPLLAVLLPVLSALAGPTTGDISKDAEDMSKDDHYFICIQLVNLTGYDICIDGVDGTNPSHTYHGKGTIIPSNEDNPESGVCYVGWRQQKAFMKGPHMSVDFHLVGHEGSRPCRLYVNCPYVKHNSMSPSSHFSEAECPPIAQPENGMGGPVYLYHNASVPSSGHYLIVTATLAFKDLGGSDGQMPAELRNQTRGNVESARARFDSLTDEELLGGKIDEAEFLP